jgi:hypothetical protein
MLATPIVSGNRYETAAHAMQGLRVTTYLMVLPVTVKESDKLEQTRTTTQRASLALGLRMFSGVIYGSIANSQHGGVQSQ